MVLIQNRNSRDESEVFMEPRKRKFDLRGTDKQEVRASGKGNEGSLRELHLPATIHLGRPTSVLGKVQCFHYIDIMWGTTTTMTMIASTSATMFVLCQ